MTAINFTNITDFGQLPAAANTASNGSFWVGMLYMCWIILLLMMVAFGWEVALLVSSFLALILGLLLTYAGLVSWYYVLTFVGIILIEFLYIIWVSPKTRY